MIYMKKTFKKNKNKSEFRDKNTNKNGTEI